MMMYNIHVVIIVICTCQIMYMTIAYRNTYLDTIHELDWFACITRLSQFVNELLLAVV